MKKIQITVEQMGPCSGKESWLYEQVSPDHDRGDSVGALVVGSHETHLPRVHLATNREISSVGSLVKSASQAFISRCIDW